MSLKSKNTPKKIQLKYTKKTYGSGLDKITDHEANIGPFSITIRECRERGLGNVIIGWLTNDHSCVTPERGMPTHANIECAKRYFEKKLLEEIRKYKDIKDYL